MLAFFLALIGHLLLFNLEARLCAVRPLIRPRGELEWTQLSTSSQQVHHIYSD